MFKICMTEDIPEREARAFELENGDIIFITQRDGAFYAYQNLCPHLQVEVNVFPGLAKVSHLKK